MTIPGTRSARLAAALIVAALALLAGPAAAQQSGYIIQPAMGPDQVVFSCEGDLWSVAAAGGVAHRITRHAGQERFPRFSPDGKSVAFTGQYAGGEDVFTMPAAGGPVVRRTHHPDPDQAVAWAADGSFVVFRSPRDMPHGRNRLWKVPVAGGLPSLLPLGEAAQIAFSPDGTRAVFTRSTHEGRYWKRYRGGTQMDLWWVDLRSMAFRRLTPDGFRGLEGFPMWANGRIYYASDRDGIMNIWTVAEDGTGARQITHHADYDVRWPSAFGSKIAYSSGGELWILDATTDQARMVDVTVPSDRPQSLPRFVEAARFMEDPILTPDGRRVVLPVRGELFLSPMSPSESRVVNLTGTDHARERGPTVSPDGTRIACVSDRSGEEQIVILPMDGSGAARDLTQDTGHWHFPPAWSPDGKRLAWSDETCTLRVMEVETRKVTDVDQSKVFEIDEYAWSPDGRWLAYARIEENKLRAIHVWSMESGKSHRVSEAESDSWSPAWDPEGKLLFFLSDRTYNPILASVDFASIFDNMTKPYLVVLRSGEKSPFAPRELEEEKKEEESEKDKDKGGKKEGAAGKPDGSGASGPAGAASPVRGAPTDPGKSAPGGVPAPGGSSLVTATSSVPASPLPTVTIDLNGISSRIEEIPVDAGHYSRLRAIKGKILYLSKPTLGIMERRASEDGKDRQSLVSYDLKEREEKPVMEGLSYYDLSGDGKKILIRKKDQVKVFDAEKGPDGEKDPKAAKGKEAKEKGIVDLAGVVLRLDPVAEWRQIFREAWRLQREFYWAPNMAGVDWPAMYRKYQPLLVKIATRGELNDLIGEMFGELATSHTYIMGGDNEGEDVKSVSIGLLGAVMEPDPAEGAWRVKRILTGDPWDEEATSPLARSHTRVSSGDLITAIDRRPLAATDSLNVRLEGLAGHPVLLSVAASAKTTAREVLVKPLASDRRLWYVDWVRANRERIDRETDGRCGYVHVPDMGGPGLVEFSRGFYPQITKKALIVDARYNRGGFVSQLIIEKLRRTLWAFMKPRHGVSETYPARVLHGHILWLADRNAGSDGDIGPQSFKMLKVGPVMGTRTWGGVVGIRMDKKFIDGGVSSQPEFAWWAPGIGWDLENNGVEPDITVDNDPSYASRGIDHQLDEAIKWVNQRLAEDPRNLPDPPPWPDKSRKPSGGK